MIFSKRAQKLSASSTMAATLRAKDKIAKGADVILASVGEPDIAVPIIAKESLAEIIKTQNSKYGSSQGLLSTRNVIGQWMSELMGTQFSSEQIVISPGSKFSLFTLLQIFCDENSEVIIPAPYWVSYETLTTLAGAKSKIVHCPPKDNYKLTADHLKRTLTKKSKILILNSPNNPTGAVYSIEELKALAAVIEETENLYVICDDIYNQLLFSIDGKKPKRSPHLLDVLPQRSHDRLILVHGASKSFSMTGWRLGWIIASKEIAKKVSEFQSQTLTCTPDFLQVALEKTLKEALANGNQFVVENVRKIESRFLKAKKHFDSIPGIRVFPSEGAFYLWIEVLQAKKTSSAICDELLENFGLALVPGSSFGFENHLRFSLTIPDSEFDKAIDRLARYFTPVQGEIK